jgi:nicotinate phosphoribosyltransferase
VSSSALFTDHYELTMVQAARHSGAADRRCVFEVFTRHLPDGRRFGVLAGTGRLLDEIDRFRFDDEVLDFLAARDVVDAGTRAWLRDYHFEGEISGYAEGEAFFPGSPVLTVAGTFAECVVLETLILSVLNHDSAVAAAAARMVAAAEGRPCLEMGSRRTHEVAAVAAARAAYLVGFAATSNLAAGARYGVPTTGTAAHAFTLVHDDEPSAFAAQVASLGPGTTLLVDTQDVLAGVRAAVEAAGKRLGSVRLDSGDLRAQARAVRALLDELGATRTRIVVTSDLDEHAIDALASEAVDAYGVGTSVVTGAGHPTAGFVYKLVARARSGDAGAPLEPVAKSSAGKVGRGGRKWASRQLDERGCAVAELVHVGHEPGPAPHRRPLVRMLLRQGETVNRTSLAEARAHHERAIAELPAKALKRSRGGPAIDTIYDPQ